MTRLAAVAGREGHFVRELTALEMVQLTEGGDIGGARGTLRFAQMCTTTAEGVRVWPDMPAVEAAPWTLVKACAEAGLSVNGLTSDQSADLEQRAGN